MSRKGWTAAALFLLGCAGLEEKERWRYEQLFYQRDPEVRSRDDARERHRRLSGQAALTLDEAYRMALFRSETLAIDGEELVRIQTLYEEAISEILPRISFVGGYTRQDTPPRPAGSSVQRSFTLRERTQYQFTLHQPVFNGLREFYAIRQAGKLHDAKEHDLRHARLLLYADVADAFYTVLLFAGDLAITEDSLRLAQERLEELVQRNLVGISRRSEVLAQEAEVARIRADLERFKGLHAVAWEMLRFLTGLPERKTLTDALPDPGEPPSIESFLGRAQANREDIRGLQGRVDAAEEAIGIARSGYLPSVSLDANYYTHREGVSEDVDWDVTLSFAIPIFEGGGTQARLRAARSLVRTANFELTRRLREIILAINRAYAALKTLQSELVSLEKAVTSIQENYEIVQAEYRRNIVTNIEVLTSFNALQRARLDRDRARIQAKLASIRLEVEAGTVPGEP